jgi:hypothetical protein
VAVREAALDVEPFINKALRGIGVHVYGDGATMYRERIGGERAGRAVGRWSFRFFKHATIIKENGDGQ